jgi:hypothetical protein
MFFSKSKAKKAVNNKYLALRVVIKSYLWVGGAVGFIGAFIGLAFLINGGDYIFRNPVEGLMALLPALGIILVGIAIIAGGELLQVFMDIERNTRPKDIDGPAAARQG